MLDPRRVAVASLLPLLTLACGQADEPSDSDAAASGGEPATTGGALTAVGGGASGTTMGSGGSPGSGASPALVGNAGNPATGGASGMGAAPPAGGGLQTGGEPGLGGSSGSGGGSPGGGTAPGGTAGTGAAASVGGGAETGGLSGEGGAPGSGGAPSSGGAESTGGIPEPLTCAEAVGPYAIAATPLDPALVPGEVAGGWGAENFAELPVAVDPTTGEVYVGFTSVAGAATIAGVEGVVASTPGAVLAGVAVTSDGVAALLFDPNETVDERTWAAVARYDWSGGVLFQTDLFRSSNLEDVGTKGAPGTGRFGYLSGSDELVAYFGHTQRYDDGVRHQGGYLAAVNGAGEQRLISGWWGSHNLDQRLLVAGAPAAILGLGDAYPEGIFFAFLEGEPRTNVIYPLASAGNGATNGQLGGLVDLGDEILVPFITNNSIPQDLDAGTWPDIDETIADQIRAAADHGTDLGILRVPRGDAPGELTATWLDPQLTEGASLAQLKSAPYGTGGLVLLAWAEISGSGWRAEVSGYYTMVIDGDGAVCQPKTALDPSLAFTSGDDLVGRPDGSIVWASDASGALAIVTLTPR